MNQKANNQFFVPHNILEEVKFTKLSASTQMVYIRLCKLKNRLGDRFFRSMDTLAKESGFGLRTLQRAKRELIKAEYIGVESDQYKASGHRRADIYHLNGFSYKLTQ